MYRHDCERESVPPFQTGPKSGVSNRVFTNFTTPYTIGNRVKGCECNVVHSLELVLNNARGKMVIHSFVKANTASKIWSLQRAKFP
jgi:hypothetical protein